MVMTIDMALVLPDVNWAMTETMQMFDRYSIIICETTAELLVWTAMRIAFSLEAQAWLFLSFKGHANTRS